MLLVSKEAVPDHIRRGIRLGIAILILSSIGFSIVGREGCENWVPVFKWGLLTCPVVTMPLLGKTSQVSFERALGTVVGGTLGFFATALSTHWWTLDATETDDIFLSIVAASAAYLAIMVGKRLSLDLSSKLFTIAFILVCFSSQEGRDPKVVAITRVGGIVLGVVTMLILSVLVLPKSASIESLRTLRKSLNKLQDVNRIAWGNYLPPEHQAAQLVAAGASQAHEQQQRRVNGRARGEDSALAQPLLGPEDVEAGQPARPALVLDLDHGCASPMPPEAAEAHVAKSEKALIDLYSVMNQLAEQLALAKTEVWISNCNGRPFLLPGLPFWHRQTNHMPWRYLEEMAVAVRRVARLLNTAIFTFEDGFDQQLREVLGPWYPPALMPTLAAACYAAIQELCDAFPGETSASGQGLAAYSVAVQSLVDMSDQQRQRVKGAFKRHKSRVGARKSWASIIDSVLEEQRNQQLSVVKEDGEQQPRDADQWQPGEPGEGSPFGRAASVSGSEAGGTAVGGTASKLIGGKAKGKHKREASFGNWIMRVSSSLGQQQGSLSGLDFAAAAAAATAAAAGDEETVSQNGSVAASVAGASEAGSQAGAGAAHGTSPVKLAGQAASAGRGVGLVGVLGSLPGGPFDVPAESAEQHLPAREPSLSFSVQPPPNMLSRASMLRQGGISFNPGNTMPLTLFPDTTQGRLAQVSFFSFMFLCEELREQLEGLHAAVDAVLLRLPS